MVFVNFNLIIYRHEQELQAIQQRQQDELDAFKHLQEKQNQMGHYEINKKPPTGQNASSLKTPLRLSGSLANNNLLDDDLLMRALQNFTMTCNGVYQAAPTPITLNQIREKQNQKWMCSNANGHITTSHSLQSSPIKRTASLTNAVAYGQQHQPLVTQTSNQSAALPAATAGRIALPTSRPSAPTVGLNHSASTSQLRNQFYFASTTGGAFPANNISSSSTASSHSSSNLISSTINTPTPPTTSPS